jgi:hypothetical protein
MEEKSRNILANEISEYANLTEINPNEAFVMGVSFVVRSTIPPSDRIVKKPTPEDFKRHNLEREQKLKKLQEGIDNEP